MSLSCAAGSKLMPCDLLLRQYIVKLSDCILTRIDLCRIDPRRSRSVMESFLKPKIPIPNSFKNLSFSVSGVPEDGEGVLSSFQYVYSKLSVEKPATVTIVANRWVERPLREIICVNPRHAVQQRT